VRLVYGRAAANMSSKRSRHHRERRPDRAHGDRRQNGRRARDAVFRVRRERRTSEPLLITEEWAADDLSDTAPKTKLSRATLYRHGRRRVSTWTALQHELPAEIAGPRNSAAALNTAMGRR